MTDEQQAYASARKKLEQKVRRLSKLRKLCKRLEDSIVFSQIELDGLAMQVLNQTYNQNDTIR